MVVLLVRILLGDGDYSPYSVVIKRKNTCLLNFSGMFSDNIYNIAWDRRVIANFIELEGGR